MNSREVDLWAADVVLDNHGIIALSVTSENQTSSRLLYTLHRHCVRWATFILEKRSVYNIFDTFNIYNTRALLVFQATLWQHSHSVTPRRLTPTTRPLCHFCAGVSQISVKQGRNRSGLTRLNLCRFGSGPSASQGSHCAWREGRVRTSHNRRWWPDSMARHKDPLPHLGLQPLIPVQ